MLGVSLAYEIPDLLDDLSILYVRFTELLDQFLVVLFARCQNGLNEIPNRSTAFVQSHQIILVQWKGLRKMSKSHSSKLRGNVRSNMHTEFSDPVSVSKNLHSYCLDVAVVFN